MKLVTDAAAAESCWKTSGIFGDRTCPRLAEHVHCRNCPVYRQAGRQLLDRPMADDYRMELTRRLAASPLVSHGDGLRLLVFRVASVWLALPSGCFEETLPPVPIVRVPQRSNRHFLGLVNAHGELQLCFTLEHFLGPDPDEPVTRASAAQVFPRFLVVSLRGQRWVFPADEVLGAIEQPRAELQALPPNLARSGQNLITALFALGPLRVKLLDAERLGELLREALA